MSERIDQFRENLRIKLTGIDNELRALKTKIDSDAKAAERDVRNHLDAVKKLVEQERSKVATAQSDIKKWVDERKVETNEKVAEWKAKREKTKLQGRADFAERYAAAAVVVALAAVDEAEQAALEAWLARKDADHVQSSKAA
jgi:hypothetical protein